MSDEVLLDRDGATAIVTLHRPDAGNAFSTALKSALVEALREVGSDDAVRAVVLTGAGSVFTVGQDLREAVQALQANPARAGDTVLAHYNPITLALASMPKPVVAAVNGTCVGAGLGFALACDLQVWASGATLATAFTGVGLTCDSGVSASLVRAVGQARASRLVLLGESFTVEQAVGWGFAGEVVPADQVLATARTLADRLAAGPTRALAASKRLLAAGSSRSLAETLQAEAVEQSALGLSRDHAVAVEAFLNRTAPVFTGS
ncbi:enoyl-CoA hydratase/isomerase family protein [Nocardioides nitrophenolicus]|uniref:enoyl-CoA hydratase/isomerase family protein n=1 Tax=Nocardioides nitrophenolicus TaxID=60489 RepID=UPI001955FFE6|nr:enoyl-CoA hydratase-related protein [Nocardioides nitrophenolicus]MBM7517466.1 2-(1,2-epoxy-1,2-dihydrophenyl)acetyl-CoA isomerase [Nocardioides nitrophenolicus]